MSDRSPKRQRSRRPDPRRGRRLQLRPAVEGLEGRALMSFGGSPDFTFGTNGLKFPAAPMGMITPIATATQVDGKILEIGELQASLTQEVIVARFNTDGSPDTTFGTYGYFTDPALTVDIATAPFGDGATGTALAIQPNGQIVGIGINGYKSVAFRLNTNGTLDTTFGTGGIATLGSEENEIHSNPGGNDHMVDFANSVTILPDGQVAVGGEDDVATISTIPNVIPGVELLNADGSIATGFGTNGFVAVPLPSDASGFPVTASYFNAAAGIVAQPDGTIVVASNVLPTITDDPSYETGILMTRFTSTGTLDTTFGTGGQVSINATTLFSTGDSLGDSTLAIQADGDLVIGGGASYHIGAGFYTRDTVLRLEPDGTLDPTFGIGGADILVNSVAPINSIVKSLTIATNGQIVVGDSNSTTFGRLDADGLPDQTFGEGGTTTFPLPSGNNENGVANVVGVSVLANNEVIGVLNTTNAPGLAPGLVRLLAQGADNDYFESGISDPAILTTAQSVFAASDPSGNTSGQITQFGSYGAGNTMPAPGAYNGGGIDEIGVYLPLLGAFAYRPYGTGTSNDVIIPFGTPGYDNDYPAEGDYDHSGKTELAVYSTAQGEFIYRSKYGSDIDITVPLGTPGVGQSIPVPADYFNTGQADFAVYLVAQGAYQIRNPNDGTVATIPFGTPGAGQSIPVPGDYDGSGHVELAVYLPASGELVYRPYNGGADVTVPFGTPGVAATIPAPGDYDGSGHTEVAGYDTSTGTFSYLPAGGGAAVSEQFGIPGNETVPFSLATDAVAESGLGEPPPPASPNVMVGLPSVEIPLTPDVLDALAGPTPKKKGGLG